MLVVEDGTGRPDANAYCDVEAADATLLDDASAPGWFGLDPAAKARRLIEATRALDAVCRWRGTRATPTQALRWPRVGVVDGDGTVISATTVPAAVRDATARLAAELTAGRWRPGEPEAASVSLGATSVAYRAAAAVVPGLPGAVGLLVRDLVRLTAAVVRA